MIWVCDTCGSAEVSQGYSVMLPINIDCCELMDYLNGEWLDYYWCSECQDDCFVEEIEDDDLDTLETKWLKDLNE